MHGNAWGCLHCRIPRGCSTSPCWTRSQIVLSLSSAHARSQEILKRFSRAPSVRGKVSDFGQQVALFAFHQVPERLLGRYCVEHGTLTPELHKPTVKKYVSLLKKAWADRILCTSNGDMSWMGASSQMSSTGGTLRVTWALCLLQTHCQIAFSLPLR